MLFSCGTCLCSVSLLRRTELGFEISVEGSQGVAELLMFTIDVYFMLLYKYQNIAVTNVSPRDSIHKKRARIFTKLSCKQNKLGKKMIARSMKMLNGSRPKIAVCQILIILSAYVAGKLQHLNGSFQFN